MISMHLQQAAASINGYLQGEDAIFSGCSTDTRQIKQNQLFIALRGENFDGHDYITDAIEKGACAAMVEEATTDQLPILVVDDCRRAMNDLAHYWRQQFGIPVVAITGSNGKTTVKEMVAAILSQTGPVLSTQGNLNNDIGVPLTLFGLNVEHQFAVIEMGANHAGEIDLLTHTADPDVAVITQCAPAHLEGFGSIQGVAEAKSEIYNGLGENGTAIINVDDDYADYWMNKTNMLHQITFGFSDRANVRASEVSLNQDNAAYSFLLAAYQKQVQLNLSIPGKHNVQNALAAAACALALNVDMQMIKQGLESFTGVPGRLQIKSGLGKCRILDDTYNANPRSLEAGIDVLTGFDNQLWLVLGDMGELGRDSAELHRQMGEHARAAGIHRLFGYGTLAREAVQAFGQGAQYFENSENLIQSLMSDLNGDIAILVKGSRAMQMEKIVQALSGEES